jgi:hypothetical protein
MDKARYPHVTRTRSMERIRVLYHQPRNPRVPQQDWAKMPARYRLPRTRP